MNRRWLLGRGAALLAITLPGAGCAALRTPRAEAIGSPVATPRPQQPTAIPGRILFVKKGDLWVLADGRQKQLTTGLRYEGGAWSPDGSLIAASVVGENHSDLMVLTATGAQSRQLTRNLSNVSIANQAWARKPAWAPTGQQIAFITDQGYTDMSLATVPAAGGATRRLVTHQIGAGGTDWPTWDTTGSHIAYVDFSERVAQIYSYSLTTGAFTALTTTTDGAFDPAWSPDGEWIAFTARDAKRTNIHVMRADGSQITAVTDTGTCRAPAWSPAGDQLAYITTSDNAFDIAVIAITLGDAVFASPPRQVTTGDRIDGPSGLSWTS